MEFRVLKYFLAIAEEGSITKAANFLNLTQPTLSRQIQDLEKELGRKLFIRGQHSVSLTNDGQFLRQYAQEIVEIVNKVEAEFRSAKNVISGTIHIGGGESMAMKLLTDIMKDIQDEYAKITFDITSGNGEDITEKLDKGLLDFAILIEPIDVTKYEYLTLPAYDIWGLIMRKDSLLAKLNYISLEDLANVPIIASRQLFRKSTQNTKFMEWFQGKFEKLNVVAKYNLIYNAALMVDSGVGYALGLDNLVSTNSNLTFRPLKPELKSGLKIVWKRTQIFSPAANMFLEKLKLKFHK